MKKKIVMFSRDPGGANTLIPLVRPLYEKGYEIRLLGKDFALDNYTKANLWFMDIMDFIKDVELDQIEGLLAYEKPDLVLTGTSADDNTEKYIWKAAEALKIPSFAIVDQWMNYGVRFSQYGVSELDMYHQDKTHPYLPTKILVMDETAKQEALKEGLDAGRIVITGQPHFEALLDIAATVTSEDIEQARSGYGASQGDFLITFVSEPISDTYHETEFTEHYWGYTERTIFKNLLLCVQGIADSCKGKIIIVLRPHPKENKNNYDDYFRVLPHKKIILIRDSDTDSSKLILSSDLVCGMSSMFLIESVLLNKPVISIQIGLKKENPFVFDRLGLLKSILDRNELNRKMKSAIIGDGLQTGSFQFIRNPIENIILLTEMHLCRN